MYSQIVFGVVKERGDAGWGQSKGKCVRVSGQQGGVRDDK